MSRPRRPFATKTEWVYERLREQILDGARKVQSLDESDRKSA